MEYDHFHFNWNSGHCCWSPLSHQCYRAWAALCNSKSGPLDGFLSCDSFPDLELKNRVILQAILNTCAFKIFPHILSCSVPLTPNDAYTIFSLTSIEKQWLSRCLTAFKNKFSWFLFYLFFRSDKTDSLEIFMYLLPSPTVPAVALHTGNQSPTGATSLEILVAQAKFYMPRATGHPLVSNPVYVS